MTERNAHWLRNAYLEFFKERGHAVIPGASLIPENDPSVLFTTAGMHPLVPYLLGEPHPAGKRLVNYQKCIRTDDIKDVGDGVHLTFFEMLGNWSLGDYFKKEAITWSYEFMSGPLALDMDRVSVTCFAGDQDAPRDTETFEIWRSLGIPEKRIFFLPKKDNWWGPAGATGPCGPDTEMFYDMNPSGPKDENLITNPSRFWEIWNDVLMEYDKKADGSYVPLAQKNIDTGLGVERVTAIIEGKTSIYETELFLPIVEKLYSLAKKKRGESERIEYAARVIADHIRSATFILAEGLVPGNLDQPYIARRLIRRSIRFGKEMGIEGNFMARVAEVVIEIMGADYRELIDRKAHILSSLDEEETRFHHTLDKGFREFERAVSEIERTGAPRHLDGRTIFRLYDTHGFPPEVTEELAREKGLTCDMEGFKKAFAEHQEKSRAGAEVRFKGGLSERSPETTKLHTATHLLHEALRRVLGRHVEQRGSNITVERLRFDFSHPTKMTPEEIKKVEDLVNEQIKKNHKVTVEELTVEEAKAAGAIGLFGDKYGEKVKVYTIGDFSKEICGGPHVEELSSLGRFKIQKEEACSAGVRRIRAVLLPE